MSILVDTSVWIDYFRGTGSADRVDRLIEENLVATNDLILAELVPPLHRRRERKLIALLREIRRHPISIDWDDLIQMQIVCLRQGVNGVGIPDLIIAQNAIQNRLELLATDKHFVLMSEHMPLSIHGK
jgi:predicted nucleic acid-binding protein